ncbi:dienelactone hydrolase family protein [Aurantibacter sp.]|uniref:dienelactone hydrolase family protein n=1 Tax=Aurantibacter sp. TaxID=2807103 RepID=UPI0032667B82
MNYFNKNILVLISITLLNLSCSSDSEPSDPVDPEPTVRTADDVIKDFQAIDFQPGINDVTLESTTIGLFWKFRVVVPTDVALNDLPLIFNLHGGAQNVDDNLHKNTECIISPGLEGILDAYIISPNSNGELWYSQNNQIQIIALHDLVTTHLSIDTDKVGITGYSDGGNGSWFYAQFYSTLFSVAIPLATSYNTISNTGEYNPLDVPVYVIHGEEDELFLLETTQNFINESIEAGSDIQFVIAPELDHYQVCDYMPYFKEGARYLATEVWQ